MKSNSYKWLLIIIVAASITFSFAFVIQNNPEDVNLSSKNIQRAVIIDQLHDEIPNTDFQSQAKEYLESAGYEVDIFTTQNVTVNFYKNLPKMNYQYIVIRSHAVSDKNPGSQVTLFTGERYSDDKYIQEQLFGQIKRGTPTLERAIFALENNSTGWIKINATHSMLQARASVVENTDDDWFLITPKLVYESMNGNFPGSTILLDGCSTLSNPSLARSFIERGASNIVGWSDLVSSSANDYMLLKVLEENLVNGQEIEDAIVSAQKDFDRNPIWPATLKSYSEKNL